MLIEKGKKTVFELFRKIIGPNICAYMQDTQLLPSSPHQCMHVHIYQHGIVAAKKDLTRFFEVNILEVCNVTVIFTH